MPHRVVVSPPAPEPNGTNITRDDSTITVVATAARFVIAAAIVAGLYFGRELLQPLAFAVLLGFLLDPAVTRLARMGLPRIAAVLLITALALGALGAAGAYLTVQVRSLGAELPTYQSTIRTKVRALRRAASGPGVLDSATDTLAAVEKELAAGATTRSRPARVEVVEPSPSALRTAQLWLDRVSGPAATAGIVILFVVLLLLDPRDVRDRLLVSVGADLHRATDAMGEAAERISKYLRMQLLVNVTYGIPMALGLWVLGVPGAILWGALATVMRFVPYVGPVIAAAFPLVLAFAVDPAWSIFLSTAALVVVLELVSNNVIEPWLYGESTGLSALAIIVAATFWTAIWGPLGLVLSTPLTVCLYVLGRHLEPLGFFRVLLGSEPVMPPSERLYQRLLANDLMEARTFALATVAASLPRDRKPGDVARALVEFYDTVGIPALRFASEHHRDVARTEQRLRVSEGMERVLSALESTYPPPQLAPEHVAIACLGARWEVDALGARMMAHALALSAFPATLGGVGPVAIGGLSDDTDVVCISSFSPQPLAQLRLLATRVRRRADVQILAATWNLPPMLDIATGRASVDADARSVRELVQHVAIRRQQASRDGVVPAPVPDDDGARTERLHASGVLRPDWTSAYHDAAVQAANAFDVDYAQVSWVDAEQVHTPGTLVPAGTRQGPLESLPRSHSICSYVVAEDDAVIVEDVARDPRFADSSALAAARIRFYAGVPLRDGDGRVLGSFCIMGKEPRTVTDTEVEVLESIAGDLMEAVQAPGGS